MRKWAQIGYSPRTQGCALREEGDYLGDTKDHVPTLLDVMRVGSFCSSNSLCVARLDGFSVQSRFQVDNLRIRDRLLRHDRWSERICVIEPFAKAPALVGQYIGSGSIAMRLAIAECPFGASGTIHRLSLYNPGRSSMLLLQVHPLLPFQ